MGLHVRHRHAYDRIPSYNHISYHIILDDYYFLCILCIYAGRLIQWGSELIENVFKILFTI